LAAAAKAANGGWLIISNGETCAARDLTVSNLRIEKGGLLKPVTGHKLILSGNFDAGPYPTFTNALAGQGTILFAPDCVVNEIFLEWWGAKGDDSTDNATMLSAAFAAAGLRRVRVSAGIFRFGTPQTLPRSLEGYGMSSVLRFMGSGSALSYANSGNNDNLVLRDVVLRVNSDKATHLLKFISLSVATIDNVHLECQQGCTTAAIELVGATGVPAQNLDIKNLNISGSAGDGIRVGGPAGLTATRISGGRIQGSRGRGINIVGTQPNQGIKISGVTIEGNYGGQIYADSLRGSEISGNFIENAVNSETPPIVGGALAGSSWLGVSVSGGNSFTTAHAPYALDLNGGTASNSVTFAGNDVSGLDPFLLATVRLTSVQNSTVGPNSLSGFQAPAAVLGSESRGILVTEKVRATGEYVVHYQSGNGRSFIRGDIVADTLDVRKRTALFESRTPSDVFPFWMASNPYDQLASFAGGLNYILKLQTLANRADLRSGSETQPSSVVFYADRLPGENSEALPMREEAKDSANNGTVTASLVDSLKEISQRVTALEQENRKLKTLIRQRR
jgi:hypothetical protein